ncbi:MAG TPA: outer membrane beta-barrel protein [Vicinamibacterales bacterium]|nr:outer membrane beta-barrel protein [Vicinamibacterales bacterium]
MPTIRLCAFAVALLVISSTPARADGFISPFIGYNFGGDSQNCVSLRNCEERRTNWGVGLGTDAAPFGFELDFGYAPDFFGKSSTTDNAVLTLMGNLLLVIPAGPVRPYGLIGLGLVRPHAKTDLASLGDTDQNTLGWDIGGGLNIFFGHTFGIRGDLRHVRTFQDITLFGVFNNAPLDFWRASAGITLRF